MSGKAGGSFTRSGRSGMATAVLAAAVSACAGTEHSGPRTCLDEVSKQAGPVVLDDFNAQMFWVPELSCEVWRDMGKECTITDRDLRAHRETILVTLDNLDEPALAEGEQTIYRMIAGPRPLLMIRVVKRKGRFWAVVKRTSAGLSYRPTIQRIERRVVSLTIEQWTLIEGSIVESGFWRMPAYMPTDDVIYDGGATSIEGVGPLGHHLVSRQGGTYPEAFERLIETFWGVAGCEKE